MIEGLSSWIEVIFGIAFLATLILFYYANGKPRKFLVLLLVWSSAHSYLAFIGFYTDFQSMPPRFGLVIIPGIIAIGVGLLPKQQDWLSQHRNMYISTFLHIVRIPVEIVLFGLFTAEMIPELMTFEGRNYDILMGISAPIVAVLFLKKYIGKRAMLIWNTIGLGFILFILINGILSAELPFQQFAFEQPNKGMSYFPFILLPAVIVPIVIWTHLSDILILWKDSLSQKEEKQASSRV